MARGEVVEGVLKARGGRRQIKNEFFLVGIYFVGLKINSACLLAVSPCFEVPWNGESEGKARERKALPTRSRDGVSQRVFF